jgi:hypothetical protein
MTAKQQQHFNGKTARPQTYPAAPKQPTNGAQRTSRFEDETQTPTRDALSAIYNKGY